MRINVLHNSQGAIHARGLTVVIDVFRAFSTECYVMRNNAEKIIPVGDLDTAYKLKVENPDFLLMGEQNGERPKDFDYGNSPFQISSVDFSRKTVIHISTAGTKGLIYAKNASEIITGSFVNIGAIVRYIKINNPDELSLVCTGSADGTILDEDALCAQYIKNELQDISNDYENIVKHIKEGGYIDRFLDPKLPKYPVEDVDYCLALDKFDFVLKASDYKDGLVKIDKVSIAS